MTAISILTGISAIGALGAAIGAWLSARATDKNTKAQIMSVLLDSYASDEMLDATIQLRSWKSRKGSAFADEFRILRQNDYEQVRELDRSRRRVSHYFQKVHTLHKECLINEKMVRAVAKRGQVEFYREINEPLEAALNPNYDHTSFDELAALYNIPKYTLPMANP